MVGMHGEKLLISGSRKLLGRRRRQENQLSPGIYGLPGQDSKMLSFLVFEHMIWLCCPGWAGTCVPLALDSQVEGITHICHHVLLL